MPTGAVYQPTTVTYEQPAESRWNCPVSYFSRRITSSFNRVVCLQLGLGVLGFVLFVAGIPMVISGSAPHAEGDGGVGLLAAGAVLIVVGLLLAGASVWLVMRRAGGGGGWSGGKDAGGGGGGTAAALTALNPSTDPLVAAQYAPVRDAPPAPDDETHNLMDNKECVSSAEESDKMLDGRPSVA